MAQCHAALQNEGQAAMRSRHLLKSVALGVMRCSDAPLDVFGGAAAVAALQRTPLVLL